MKKILKKDFDGKINASNIQKIFSDTAFLLKGVTSLTLYNAANSKVSFRERTLEKGDYYQFDGDGTATDIDFEISFEGGHGEAVKAHAITSF